MLALAGANQPLRVSALHKAWQAKGFDNSSWPSICESVCAGPPWVQSIAEYVASCPTSGDWIQDLSASLKVSKISNTPQLGQEFLAKVAKVQGTSDSMLSAMNLEPPPVFGRVEIKNRKQPKTVKSHGTRLFAHPGRSGYAARAVHQERTFEGEFAWANRPGYWWLSAAASPPLPETHLKSLRVAMISNSGQVVNMIICTRV